MAAMTGQKKPSKPRPLQRTPPRTPRSSLRRSGPQAPPPTQQHAAATDPSPLPTNRATHHLQLANLGDLLHKAVILNGQSTPSVDNNTAPIVSLQPANELIQSQSALPNLPPGQLHSAAAISIGIALGADTDMTESSEAKSNGHDSKDPARGFDSAHALSAVETKEATPCTERIRGKLAEDVLAVNLGSLPTISAEDSNESSDMHLHPHQTNSARPLLPSTSNSGSLSQAASLDSMKAAIRDSMDLRTATATRLTMRQTQPLNIQFANIPSLTADAIIRLPTTAAIASVGQQPQSVATNNGTQRRVTATQQAVSSTNKPADGSPRVYTIGNTVSAPMSEVPARPSLAATAIAAMARPSVPTAVAPAPIVPVAVAPTIVP